MKHRRHQWHPSKLRPLEERFWARVTKTDSCWNWSPVAGEGYGIITLPRKSGVVLAHRLLWEWTNGPIPKGQHVCHRCDNRACVNPSHLFLGSARDNHLDAVKKGRKPTHPQRKSWPKNEAHWAARLSDADVSEIRRRRAVAKPQTYRELAERFGVSRRHIIRIAKNESRDLS